MNYQKSGALLLAFLIWGIAVAHAAVFTVTSNADTGPGTLRDALTQSAANGNSETDYIYFNLAVPVINVYSALPFITSSLVIDGTTQPGFGSVNGAKVTVVGAGNWTIAPNCFEVHDADDFEIYGIVVTHFYNDKSAGSFTGGSAVSLAGKTSRAIIGAAGKGNVFYDNGTGIINAPQNGQQITSDVAYCEIKANILGLLPDGTTFSDAVQAAIVLSYTRQAVIGGNSKAEGNIIYGSLIWSPYYDGVSVLVQNNNLGANSAYQQNPYFTSDATQLYVVTQVSVATQVSQVTFMDNVFGTKLSVYNFTNINLLIQHNFFGTSPDRSKSMPIQGQALSLYNLSGTVLVGGDDVSKGNVFTNAVQNPVDVADKDAVVEADAATTVELSHNSYYCNNDAPFVYLHTTPATKPITCTLDNLTATSVSGTTKPNARVELFYTDKECKQCQPETYIASVNADAAGNWTYNASLQSGYGVMAAATLNKVSSEFTVPQIYEDQVKVQPQTCTALGSITGLVTVNVTQLTWLNGAGKVVGTGDDLLNVPAGNYQLTANQFGCVRYSMTYTLPDDRPMVTDNGLIITNTLCNNSKGSITGLQANQNATAFKWLDSNGNPVSTTLDLLNVPAGSYTLQLIGTLCTNTYGPVKIGNNPDDLAILPGTGAVTADQCNQLLGSIKGVKAKAGQPPYQYTWLNAKGETLTNSTDLTGIGAGVYTLKISDAACGLATQSYTIDNQETVLSPPALKDFKICGTEAIIHISNPVAGYRYRLYDDIQSNTPLQEGTSGVFDVKLTLSRSYYVSILIGDCESARSPVAITISHDLFSVSNTFSPNGDGINDVWEINGLDVYPGALVQVFNRLGQLIFQSKGYAKPFDGTYNGKNLPTGVYYYIINVNTGCNVLSGSLTIIR